MPREPRDLSLIDSEYRMGQSETLDISPRIAETW